MTPSHQIEPLRDDAPVVSPFERHSVVEVDTFCTGCHYNLHGQVVTIDPRLGFPVCRCPECGKFHPAGAGVTASAIWLRRGASLLLIGWIFTVLALAIGVCFAAAGIETASLAMYSYNFQADSAGHPVHWSGSRSGTANYVIAGTNITADRMIDYVMLRPWTGDPERPQDPGTGAMILLCLASMVLGYIAATACVNLLWHWPRRRYSWCMLLAILPAAFLMITFYANEEFKLIHLQCAERVGTQMGLQLSGIAVGVMTGRSLGRMVARTIIPPKPRQALAYLWLVDGLKPPV